MNTEPVAWMWLEDGCNMGVCLDQDKQIGKQEFQDYSIPLYTHPVKELTDEEKAKENLRKLDLELKAQELTDEEIMNIFNNWTNSKQEHNLPANNQNYFYQEMLGFARAILRKAQEK